MHKIQRIDFITIYFSQLEHNFENYKMAKKKLSETSSIHDLHV